MERVTRQKPFQPALCELGGVIMAARRVRDARRWWRWGEYRASTLVQKSKVLVLADLYHYTLQIISEPS